VDGETEIRQLGHTYYEAVIESIRFMKNMTLYVFACLAVSLSTHTCAQERTGSKPSSSTVFPRGVRITNDNFKGTAYLKMLMDADSVNPTTVGNVTFEAGARTKWHMHPGGQILLVIDGVGYYQEKAQPKKVLKRGDVIKCPANVPHWHGASSYDAFVQLAITNRHLGETVWLQEVTEEEYNN
jgi:quercetin dioxygenase-like cupin family protein